MIHESASGGEGARLAQCVVGMKREGLDFPPGVTHATCKAVPTAVLDFEPYGIVNLTSVHRPGADGVCASLVIVAM